MQIKEVHCEDCDFYSWDVELIKGIEEGTNSICPICGAKTSVSMVHINEIDLLSEMLNKK